MMDKRSRRLSNSELVGGVLIITTKSVIGPSVPPGDLSFASTYNNGSNRTLVIKKPAELFQVEGSGMTNMQVEGTKESRDAHVEQRRPWPEAHIHLGHRGRCCVERAMRDREKGV